MASKRRLFRVWGTVVIVALVSEASTEDVCLGERCSLFSTQRCAAGTTCRGSWWTPYCLPGSPSTVPSPDLSLPYNRNAFLVTHNSYSSLATWHFFAANQEHTIERQLAEGVRGFMLDLHNYQDQVHLCHFRCDLFTRVGKSPETLSSALAAFKSFLDQNPQEVLTIFLESYVSPSEISTAFDRAGLLPYVYPKSMWPAAGQDWPALRNMTPAVVVFDSNDWDVLKESMYGTMDTNKCDERPESLSQSNRSRNLLLVNHFAPVLGLYNEYASLKRKLSRCRETLGQWANFVAVDYYHSGDPNGGAAMAVHYLQSKLKALSLGSQCA